MMITWARDWTVETIHTQFINNRIVFPRGKRVTNRWSDGKRSRFMESLIIGIPIPSIFLLDDGNQLFSILDGYERISTIAGFIEPDEEESWINPLLNIGPNNNLNGKSFMSLDDDTSRLLMNASIRCVFFKDCDDINDLIVRYGW